MRRRTSRSGSRPERVDGEPRHPTDAWADVRASLEVCLAQPAFARRLYVRLASGPEPLGRRVRAVTARRVIAGLPHALTTAVHFAGACGPARYELERLALIHSRAGLGNEPTVMRASIDAVIAGLRASDPGWSEHRERRWRHVLGIAERGLRGAAPSA